ncbi:paraneoplastic antigen-like protein 8B [Hipposideros larvatus]
MAMSLLRDWCRGLDVDVHRALLVTDIPEGLEQAAIEAVLQPAFLPVGTFRVRNTRIMRDEKAKAALVEFVEDIDHSSIPREIPRKDGVWRVLCKDRAEDTRVLRQMKRLLLDERPRQAEVPRVPRDTPTPPTSETEAQGSEPAARETGCPHGAASKARRGRRGRRSRARGNRFTQKGKKRGRGGRPCTSARRESEDSSDDSLGIVIEELDEGDLSGDDDQRALYATLQVAAKELVKKWSLQGDADDEEDGPREFLALVTVTDKAKRKEMDKEPLGAEPISLNIEEDRSGVPVFFDVQADRLSPKSSLSISFLLALSVTVTRAKNSRGPSSSSSASPWRDHFFTSSLAATWSVAYSALWSSSPLRSPSSSSSITMPRLSKDTSGPRVKVEEAGRQVDAMVLRKAKDDGNLLECMSTLAEPETPSKGKKAPRGLLGGWGDEEDDEVGLLELVALLAAQDTAEMMKEEKEEAWEGGKFKYAKGSLREVLALLAERENRESEEESEEASDGGSEEASEDTESEESEPEDRASRKPRAKRARTASKVLGQAGAPSGSRKTRRGGRGRGGRGITPEKNAMDEAAGDKKKKGRAGVGARAKAGEAKGQPPTGFKSARGKKARRGRRLPPKCR